jgi:hypothetical protein
MASPGGFILRGRFIVVAVVMGWPMGSIVICFFELIPNTKQLKYPNICHNIKYFDTYCALKKKTNPLQVHG